MATDNKRRLLFVAAAGLMVMATEVVGGILSNSLVLIADAAHYATDVAAVLLAFLAVTWAQKAATKKRTFGYHRAEVLAAFINAVALWGISIYFLYEAYVRILNPPSVEGPVVFAIGGLTLAVNILLAIVLQRGSGHNINMRAAYVHILSDVLGSAAALLAGALIYYKGLHIADPILTLFITLLILIFTWKLTRQTMHILMQGTPANIDADHVAASIREHPKVKDLHDLHIWNIATGIDSLTVHVVLKEPTVDDQVSHDLYRHLKDTYKLDHITVQVESPACPCTSTSCVWTASSGSGA